MAGYKPQSPFNVALTVLVPTYSNSHGVTVKSYSNDNSFEIFGSFRTFGGTEKISDGIYSIENTAVIETWYRPDINANCRIKVSQTNDIYEILGEPENIQLRNQFLKFKVRIVKGGA